MTFTLCGTDGPGHKKYNEKCIAPFLQAWEKPPWKQSRDQLCGMLESWVRNKQITPPEQVIYVQKIKN
eukprot:6380804-Karenia_brevis.AAC.1